MFGSDRDDAGAVPPWPTSCVLEHAGDSTRGRAARLGLMLGGGLGLGAAIGCLAHRHGSELRRRLRVIPLRQHPGQLGAAGAARSGGSAQLDGGAGGGADGGGRGGLCGSLRWLCRVGLAGKTAREVVAEGDAFFDARRFALAEERYLKAIKRSPDGVYCSLLFHRMAWGHLLSGEEDEAMGRFEQAVRSTVEKAAAAAALGSTVKTVLG